MKNGLYYLAGPHKGTNAQEAYRVEMSLKITAAFLTQGIHVFSPIVYISKIAEGLHSLPLEERRELIMAYLFDFLTLSKGMILMTLDGWQQSWGVQQELKFCQAHQIPVFLLHPTDDLENVSQVLHTSLPPEEINKLLKAA